jgi:hypothetical protein
VRYRRAAIRLSVGFLALLAVSSAAQAQLSLSVTFQDTNHDLKAVAPDGTAFAIQLDDADSSLYASTDRARTWTLRGSHPARSSFRVVTALSDGVLIADTDGGAHALSRSTDGGVTWTDVLSTGAVPHALAALHRRTLWRRLLRRVPGLHR